MELLKVKRYAELIDEFARQADEPLQVEETSLEEKGTSQKGKKDVIEIIEYFSNMLVKYFYSEDQLNEISIVESGFDSEQLWLFIECLIKEKKLDNLLSFFEKYERELDSRVGNGTESEECSDEEEDATAGGATQKKRKVNTVNGTKRVKMKVGGPSSKRRKVHFSEEGSNFSNATTVSVDGSEVDQNNGSASGGDHFFDEDEMHQFLDKEERKVLRGQSGGSSNEGESDDGDDSGDDSGGDVDLNEFECDYEEGRKLKYGDFYQGGKNHEEDDNDDEEDDEEEEDEEEDGKYSDEEDDEEENDDDDEEEDEKSDVEEEDDDEEEDSDDDEDDDHGDDDRRGRNRRNRKERDEEIEQELHEINQFDSLHRGGDDDAESNDAASDDAGMDDAKMDRDKIEKELVQKKHWSLTGEVFAHDRPKNSLLNLNVDIPKLSSGGNDAYVSKAVGEEEDDDDDENTEGADGSQTEKGGKKHLSKSKRRNLLNDEIETVVKQRIQNMLFDDVEKKRIEDLDLLINESKEKDGKEDEVNFDHLNFNKSKLSLADEYTKKYEEEIKKNPSEKKEINLQKLELMNLYKKIIHCCDSLCNDYYLPKPALLNPSNKNDQFSSLHIEETVPIILSEKDRSAPEQLFQPGHIKQLDEMHQKEKKSIRKSNKVKRKKKLLHLFGQSGKGISELKKRNEYLTGKNKKVKEEKESAAKYGVGSKNQLQGKGPSRYDFAGAISQAQARDARGQAGKRQKG
ncbi:Uncharacterized protein PCOAH_00014320 [Plasmodium coatneyi]|uniref:Uncharacterized protein n=1 Tax=Plasmodium coatneyi TaxID=208452 RepID=A0A1B1DX34_9APIC|nr:Uncharacterized protein PCOAH_00014320 [Plasmodium coatneyi]ANQ07189.1 Uncharacterized protein PCOAH_00014320 [Plasmodium coatneyi]